MGKGASSPQRSSSLTHKLFSYGLMHPLRDVHQIYAQIRETEPVQKVESERGDAWLITRYRDVSPILQDPQTFSSIANAKGIGLVVGRTMIELDGSEHLQQRRLVTPAFSPKNVREAATQLIDTTITDLVAEFANNGEADLVEQFTSTFPVRVITSLIGVPVTDYRQFHTWALQLINVNDDPEAGFAGARKIVNHLKPIIEERRRRPQKDLLSQLAQIRIDDERLLEEEILSFLRLLLPAGAETSYRLTGTLLHVLLHRPKLLALARCQPEILPKIIEETLRWESPVQYVTRETTCEVQIAQKKIPAGSTIMAVIGSANRDRDIFAHPDTFDYQRENNRDHLAFGFGTHFCLGTHLARMEAQRAAAYLLKTLPGLRLDERHTSHIAGIAFRSPDQLRVRFDS